MKLIIAFVCLFAGVQLASAQEKTAKTPEERAALYTEQLTKELALDKDQQEKISSINLRTAQKNDALKNNQAIPPEKQKELIKKNNNLRADQIKTVLTEEQKVKFEKFEAERMAKKVKKGNETEE